MASFIFILLCAVYGCVVTTTDIDFSNWQYWVTLGCICGSYICGTFSKKKNR